MSYRRKELINLDTLEARIKSEHKPTPKRILEIMEEMYRELTEGG